MRKYIQTRNLRMQDLISLYKSYVRASTITKIHFHPDYFNPIKSIACLKESILFICSTIPLMRSILRKVSKPYYLCQVAVDKNEIAGMFHLKVKDSFASFGIFLRDKYQGQGIGSILMERAVQLAAKKGIREISLTVLKENKRAINLYTKFGFEVTEELKGADKYKGRKHSSYKMKVRLEKSKFPWIFRP